MQINRFVMKTSSKAKESEIKRLEKEGEKFVELRKKDPENGRYIINFFDQFSNLGNYCILTEYCLVSSIRLLFTT